MSAAGPGAGAGSFSEMTVEQLLDLLAARTSAPASGSAAGVTVALAAALCAMSARFSASSFGAADDIAETADRLRERALRLAEEDARAYAAVIKARRLPATVSWPERKDALGKALVLAVAVPRQIAEIGAEIGMLASRIATEGNANVLGDALSAMLLAEAAASAASTIAEINLGDHDEEAASGA